MLVFFLQYYRFFPIIILAMQSSAMLLDVFHGCIITEGEIGTIGYGLLHGMPAAVEARGEGVMRS